MAHEIERTRREAESMWDRAVTEDRRRIQGLQAERDRIEREAAARAEIMRREEAERERTAQARREEIRRQEELLSGRKTRAKTADPGLGEFHPGGGIQIYHYKDPGTANKFSDTIFY